MAAPQLFFADLVRESCTAGGTGPLALAGALPGHRSFGATVPQGALFHYAICGVAAPAQWETGTGRLDAQGRLERLTIAASSDGGGAATAFHAGLKTVALTVGAGWFAGASQPLQLGEVDGLAAALDSRQPISTSHGEVAQADASDRLTVRRGSGWVNVPASAFVRPQAGGAVGIGTATPAALLDVQGQIAGGFGAMQATGTLDWNHSSNARSGNGLTALEGTAANGPGAGATDYYHSFSFEYASKDGSGNMTQFAVPYFGGSSFYGFRHRYNGAWSAWRTILCDDGTAFNPLADNNRSLGGASRRFTQLFAANGTIVTSDERDKKDAGPLPDQWLDAWGAVEWCRYKMLDGERWHIGLIAQRVHAAFAAHGVDAFAIGLLCRDALPDANSQDAAAQPAGKRADRWGVRYEECLAMEAAWNRRELSRIAARLSRRRPKTASGGRAT